MSSIRSIVCVLSVSTVSLALCLDNYVLPISCSTKLEDSGASRLGDQSRLLLGSLLEGELAFRLRLPDLFPPSDTYWVAELSRLLRDSIREYRSFPLSEDRKNPTRLSSLMPYPVGFSVQ